MQNEARKFGDIDFTGKDIGIPATPFDKLAINARGEILLLSVFTDAVRIKAMRAILCGGAKAVANASGIRVGTPGADHYDTHQPGRLTPTADGYTLYQHKLGFGISHAMFITKMPGFMKVVSDEALWQELNDPRFTTPLLREWMPYIETRLRSDRILEDAYAFGCACGILSASTKNLDAIVTDGLERMDLIVPQGTVRHSDEKETQCSAA